jgi:NADH-quinone oxidoreductase subunit A
MYFDYLNVLVFGSVGLLFVFANMIVGSLIRPKRKTDHGLEVYECGEETIGEAWIQFDIRYYTVALIYVIFAVEITFLFPWAMVLNEGFANPAIGFFALGKGLLFVTILFLGLAAVWVKGDLDWVLTYEGPKYIPTSERSQPSLPTLDELNETSADGAGADNDDDTPTDEEAA